MNTAPHRPTILAVNDETPVLELLTVLLTHEGYSVVAASNGRHALELAHKVEPDIIISDVLMPLMDGMELCRRLKEDARTASVPVLLVSAVRKSAQDNLEGLNAGADDYLEMPFRRQELLVKVARLIERHRVERHYREIVEQAADIIYTRDMQGRITSINEAGARFFGRTASELVGQSLSIMLGDEDEASADIAETQYNTSGEPLRSVRCLKDASGVPHYLEAMMTFVRNAEGQPVGVRGVVRDITERWKTEEALRESEARYRALIEQSSNGIFLVDVATKRVLEANPAYRKFLGYSTEEICALTLYDITTSEREIVNSNIECILSEGHRAIGERQHRRKDGSLVDVEVSVNRISYDGKEVMCIMARDITERKRVEAELQASEAELRALFSAMTDVILVLDAEGRYLKIAPTNPSLLYSPSAELIGKRLHDVFSESQADEFLGHVRHALETRQPVNIEYDLNIRGNHFWFSGTVSPMLGNKVLWVARDITERKLVEEALGQQVEREALINRISSAVRGSLDAAEIFRTAVREIGLHLNVDRCALFMLDQEARMARNTAEYNAPGVAQGGREYPMALIADLLAGIKQQGVLSFDDAASDERIGQLYQSTLRRMGVRSIMYVGIKVGEETLACFAISTTRSLRHWSEKDIALAKAVADQTGIAIRQAELYQKAEATSTRESLINRLGLAIRASLSLPEVLTTATRELGHALAASRVHLYLYNADRSNSTAEHEYIADGSSSVKHISYNFESPLGQRLQRSMQPVVIEDAMSYSSGTPEYDAYIRSHALRFGVRSHVNYPLQVSGQFRGALCIHQTDRMRRWTDDEVALVQAVAAQLATGIAQAELFEMTKRAKKEWETTFNAMSDGIFIFDHQGQLVRVNRAGAAMEDSWPHLLLGHHCCDILRVSADKTCIVEKCIAEGRSVTVEVVPERYNRPLLVTVEPLFHSESNTVGAVCTARDLSELRKVEAVARERQSLLTHILESVSDPICALDAEGNFLWANTASTATSGYRTEDLIGHHFLEILHEADREMAQKNFQTALQGQPCSYEVRYLTRQGEVRDALYYHAPLVIDGRTTGVLGIARDITELKQQQKRAAQADKLRALGQLASGVAHDFNNALAAILGRAQLMRRQIHTEALARNLDIIQTAAEDAAATVRRIQTFARQSKEQEFELHDASSLLHDAVEITRTRWEDEARMRGLYYDVKVEAGEMLYTSGNASELREVFVNLIVNAVDAMPQGGRLLITGAQEDDRVRLRFSDTGTGMPEDVRERIFEPFYTTKGANGTGLGLAVSYSIIERHGGQINVASELGQGTTFELDLPAAVPSEIPAGQQTEVAHTPSLNILVVDDEMFVRETMTDMLEALAHKVTMAASGPEALVKLAAGDYDLVFTDLSMPGMDGREVAREIRRLWPDLSLVLVTGYGKGAESLNGESDLFDALIAKPFDFSQVSETIAQAMEKTMVSNR